MEPRKCKNAGPVYAGVSSPDFNDPSPVTLTQKMICAAYDDEGQAMSVVIASFICCVEPKTEKRKRTKNKHLQQVSNEPTKLQRVRAKMCVPQKMCMREAPKCSPMNCVPPL